MNKTIFIFSSVIISVLSLVYIYNLEAQSGGCKAEITSDQYARDDDFDGYPDFVEIGAGYKSNSDDCLKKMKCGRLTDLARIGEKKNILIILDASGSMSGRTSSGKSRMETAKDAISSYLDILPDDSSVGLVVYSAKGFKGGGCDKIKLVSPVQRINKDKLKAEVNSVQESGQTPMAASIKFSAQIFEQFPDDDNHIILISDGQESCGGNPVQEVYDIRSGKGRPQVDVIGLCVSGRAEKQLRCMAEVSLGKFHSVDNAEGLDRVLKDSFRSSRDFYKTLVCLQKDFDTYMRCENTKFNRADQWIIKSEVKASDEMKLKLGAAKEQITRRNAQVQKLNLDRLKKKAEKIEKDTK